VTDNIRKLVRHGTVAETLDHTARTPGVKAVVIIVQGADEAWTPYWSQTTLSGVSFALRVANIKLDRILRGEDNAWLLPPKADA